MSCRIFFVSSQSLCLSGKESPFYGPQQLFRLAMTPCCKNVINIQNIIDHWWYVLDFADPYVHISFLHVSKTTEVITATLNPTWDQTLIFDNVELYENPASIARYPPSVILEIYDRDQVVHPFIGTKCSMAVSIIVGLLVLWLHYWAAKPRTCLPFAPKCGVVVKEPG